MMNKQAKGKAEIFYHVTNDCIKQTIDKADPRHKENRPQFIQNENPVYFIIILILDLSKLEFLFAKNLKNKPYCCIVVLP